VGVGGETFPHPTPNSPLPRTHNWRVRRLACLFVILAACASAPPPATSPYTLILGIAQDGGYPQAGCNRPDCVAAWRNPKLRQRVASLAIVDPQSHQRWIIDATPDFPSQLASLDAIAPRGNALLDGILLTHAHIGHYLGLAHLGREVLGGAFDQGLRDAAHARVSPAQRPLGSARETAEHRTGADRGRRSHRAERADHGHAAARPAPRRILGDRRLHRSRPSRSILWLPDIDKWEKWSTPLESVLARVDVAYIDGTFYDATELPGRDLREIPHPLITETLARLANSPLRAKVRFIHLNQSNPLLRERRRDVAVARDGERSGL